MVDPIRIVYMMNLIAYLIGSSINDLVWSDIFRLFGLPYKTIFSSWISLQFAFFVAIIVLTIICIQGIFSNVFGILTLPITIVTYLVLGSFTAKIFFATKIWMLLLLFVQCAVSING
jgi:hypothetical protein